jgi:alpha,alpha-trehalase
LLDAGARGKNPFGAEIPRPVDANQEIIIMTRPSISTTGAAPLAAPTTRNDRIHSVRRFIEANWIQTVRSQTEDEGTLIGLPFPYTIPSRKDAFQELYYWDTYFTCLGLVESGRTDLAVGNARNLLAQVDRYGFVPNGNRTFYLNRSQPPYLAPLVWHLSSLLNDIDFARDAMSAIRREYDFWTTQRITPVGLSRHGHHANREGLLDFFPEIVHRAGGLNGKQPEDCVEEISHLMAECETGWDLNHRFGHRCGDFCPVDLNSTLFVYERFLSEFSEGANKVPWLERAEERKQKMNEFCWDEERGGFFDYDFRQQRRSTIIAVSTFEPLWAGLATPHQAKMLVEKMLPQLEFPSGLAACAPGPRDRVCQWDYPNGWPCVQNLVYRGLAYYGFHKEARRIAEKYVVTVCQCFEATGDLWEKYNVEDGSVNSTNETGYAESAVRNFSDIPENTAHAAPPAMMGWTAGVFLDAVAFLDQRAKPLGHHRGGGYEPN